MQYVKPRKGVRTRVQGYQYYTYMTGTVCGPGGGCKHYVNIISLNAFPYKIVTISLYVGCMLHLSGITPRGVTCHELWHC
jgi:hypothetical protein